MKFLVAMIPAQLDQSLLHTISQSGPVVQFVLFILTGMSVYTFAIIIIKAVLFRKANAQDETFDDIFWKHKKLESILTETKPLEFSPLAITFRAGYRELAKIRAESEEDALAPPDQLELLHRHLKKIGEQEITRLEARLGFLATVAAAAPFIGLFGTVVGILNAFRAIGAAGSANLAVVAPAIGEALVATAVGLAAAIPAVIAYNFFIAKVRRSGQRIEHFVDDFLAIAARHFLR